MLAFIASVFSVIRHPIEREPALTVCRTQWQTIVCEQFLHKMLCLIKYSITLPLYPPNLRYLASSKFTSANSH